jgi:hypothetical protein
MITRDRIIDSVPALSFATSSRQALLPVGNNASQDRVACRQGSLPNRDDLRSLAIMYDERQINVIRRGVCHAIALCQDSTAPYSAGSDRR